MHRFWSEEDELTSGRTAALFIQRGPERSPVERSITRHILSLHSPDLSLKTRSNILPSRVRFFVHTELQSPDTDSLGTYKTLPSKSPATFIQTPGDPNGVRKKHTTYSKAKNTSRHVSQHQQHHRKSFRLRIFPANSQR